MLLGKSCEGRARGLWGQELAHTGHLDPGRAPLVHPLWSRGSAVVYSLQGCDPQQ